jgi:DNA-binding NarL/FixJ family response regulator
VSLALIIEDHPLFSDALSLTLTGYVGITSVEAVGRLDAALLRLSVPPLPDVIVLDLHLPDVTGLDGLIRLRAVAGMVPIVVVSSLTEPRVIAAVLQAGAAGFVPKHSEREVFREAFGRIMAGERYAPQSSGIYPNEAASNGLFAKLALLTPQQGRILHLICAGKLNKQIAFDLSITEPTVKAHVTAIMRKLGVQSRTQAVVMARGANFDALLSLGGEG